MPYVCLEKDCWSQRSALSVNLPQRPNESYYGELKDSFGRKYLAVPVT